MNKYDEHTTFLDVLFNMTAMFMVLFAISVLFIKKTDEESVKQIESKAEYIIYVEWGHDTGADVDTWVQDPTGQIISYRKKDGNLMHLDRDDLGRRDIIEHNGMLIELKENRETVTIRKLVPGEYVLNLHLFNIINDNKLPVVTNVRVDRINPSVITVFEDSISLLERGHETTVLRFTLDELGNITKTRRTQKKFIGG